MELYIFLRGGQTRSSARKSFALRDLLQTLRRTHCFLACWQDTHTLIGPLPLRSMVAWLSARIVRRLIWDWSLMCWIPCQKILLVSCFVACTTRIAWQWNQLRYSWTWHLLCFVRSSSFRKVHLQHVHISCNHFADSVFVFSYLCSCSDNQTYLQMRLQLTFESNPHSPKSFFECVDASMCQAHHDGTYDKLILLKHH